MIFVLWSAGIVTCAVVVAVIIIRKFTALVNKTLFAVNWIVEHSIGSKGINIYRSLCTRYYPPQDQITGVFLEVVRYILVWD